MTGNRTMKCTRPNFAPTSSMATKTYREYTTAYAGTTVTVDFEAGTVETTPGGGNHAQ